LCVGEKTAQVNHQCRQTSVPARELPQAEAIRSQSKQMELLLRGEIILTIMDTQVKLMFHKNLARALQLRLGDIIRLHCD